VTAIAQVPSEFESVKMDAGSEDLDNMNPSNVGRLHPDFPMDTTAGRFKRNLQKANKAT
jgi:hypothetical protein